MTQELLYRMSCRAARDLLHGLECGNFTQVQEKLTAIRRFLDLAEGVPVEALHGSALYHREQLELLAGITDHLTGALSGIQDKIKGELDGMAANQTLLRHLVATEAVEAATPLLQLPAAGYTWRGAPTA
jgi:hypothetical protein